VRRADSQDDPRQGRAAVGNRITLNDSNSDEEQNGMLPSPHTARHGSSTTACLQQIVILCMLTVIKVKQIQLLWFVGTPDCGRTGAIILQGML